MIELIVDDYTPLREYHNEFGDFSDGWKWDSALIDSDGNNQLLLYTPEQLQLFINFFYAYHGRQFKDRKVQSFFESTDFSFFAMDAGKNRYRPDRNFRDSVFNEYERKNLHYLTEIGKYLFGN